ncbi:MAG: ThuA domain-containing protein [Opitutaceae bacterium]|nr:ThuA domain-containing protein [Opitutaceae bacterium]
MPLHRSLRLRLPLALALGFAAPCLAGAATPIKVMLLTGQSNQYHDWAKSAPVVRDALASTGLFAVDVVTTPPKGADMSGFAPKWSDYAAVVMVYEGAEFPEATKAAFVAYMKNGGGLVTVHDSDNAFPYWKEFNEMIAVGGWGFRPNGTIGARDATWGPKIRWRDGKMVLDAETPGNASHPPRGDFVVKTRTPDHPIMRGLPAEWLHANDEIYSHLRGPAKNVTVLATAHADKTKTPTASGEHEPMLMTITYGRGRVFHTTLGHVAPRDTAPFPSIQCAGFIVTLQRGTEWAATGKVTQKVPADFPTAAKTSVRAP